MVAMVAVVPMAAITIIQTIAIIETHNNYIFVFKT